MNGLIQSWSKSWGSRMKLGPPWRKRINRWSVETSQPTCVNSLTSTNSCESASNFWRNMKAQPLAQVSLAQVLKSQSRASRGALMLTDPSAYSASDPSAQRLLNIAEKKLEAFRDASPVFRFSNVFSCLLRSHETGLDQQRHKTCIDQPWNRSKQQEDEFGMDHWSRYYENTNAAMR